MVRPDAPGWFSWTVSAVFHLEVLVFAALVIGEEVETRGDVDPIVYDSVAYLSPPPPFLHVEWLPEWTGPWSVSCRHEALIRMARKWPEEVLYDTPCRECGWSWGAIRAMLWD
jgi:hypothetical protein